MVELRGMTDEERAQRLLRDDAVRRLAARLGVKPHREGSPPAALLLMLEDGTKYSWDELVFAHLDRIDAAFAVSA